MNILITGGAGFIGSHMALELSARGHKIRVIDNFDPYYNPQIKLHSAKILNSKGIILHQLDISSDPIAEAVKGIDLVVNLAAQPGNDANTPYASYIRNNLNTTVALLEALKKQKTALIHISTSSVYGVNALGNETTPPAPVSPYGVTKVAAEQAVMSAFRRGEVDACILRYFSVYGERERPDKLFPRLFTALKHGTEFPLFEGSLAHERSFSYVGDIVRGTLCAIEQFDKAKGETFNIGSDLCFTTGQAIEIAQQVSGQALKVKMLPARPGDQAATKANIDKARAILGYSPQVTLPQGLARVWEWAKVEL